MRLSKPSSSEIVECQPNFLSRLTSLVCEELRLVCYIPDYFPLKPTTFATVSVNCLIVQSSPVPTLIWLNIGSVFAA